MGMDLNPWYRAKSCVPSFRSFLGEDPCTFVPRRRVQPSPFCKTVAEETGCTAREARMGMEGEKEP
eukprot:5963260-Alexandrium_andersonii.AAC.1